MNEQNLIRTTDLTETERRAMARRAGIASGEARRRKKSMREWAEVLGETPMKLRLPDGTQEDGDVNGAVVMKQMMKAVNNGDTKAAEFLMRLRGEDVQKHEFVDSEATKAAVADALRSLYGIETGGGDGEE